MNNINGYHAYQSTLSTVAATQQNSRSAVTERTAAQKETEVQSAKKTSNKPPVLSDKAKALLQELKKTYNNMDFIVSDCDSEEEAQSQLAKGTKEYTVLIDTEELERMAEDEEVKTKNLALLDEAVANLDTLKEKLKDSENEDAVVHLGVVIGRDGEVSYFAELNKIGERQKEFVDKIREEKKEAQAEAEEENAAKAEAKAAETTQTVSYGKMRRTTLSASTIDELIQKINDLDWSTIPEETILPETTGSRFDLSI